MPFIDLSNNFPKIEGKYYVEVHKMFGFERVVNAMWHVGKGFEPIDYKLAPDEFIKTWWDVED